MRILDVAFRDIQMLDADTLRSSRHSPAVVEVTAETDALVAAREARAKNAGLIVVTEAGSVRGIVAPRTARMRIGSFRGSAPPDLEAALSELLHDPQERERGFQHEWLNYEQPELFMCSTGPHYTDEWPCKYHGGSTAASGPAEAGPERRPLAAE